MSTSSHTTIAIIPPGTLVFVRADRITVIRQEVVDVRISKNGLQYNVGGKYYTPESVCLTAEKAFTD